MSLSSYLSVILLIFVFLAVGGGDPQPEIAARHVDKVSYSSFTPKGADDVIQKHKYPLESHSVRTQDGYILTLHRIPHGLGQENNKRGPPILLHSGFMGSSGEWVVLGPNRSLGFVLADAGFDVWLANPRGSTYSKNHTRLETTDRAFWEFSWHEIGYYDLPAEIDYILRVTGRPSLSYGCISMGSTVFWVLGATRPEYMKKINKMVAFGPVAYCEQATDPLIEMMARLVTDYDWMVEKSKLGEILTPSYMMKTVTRSICVDNAWTTALCKSVARTYGIDATNVKASDIAEIFDYAPAGTSLKTLLHFAQIVAKAPVFQMYDYGKEKNVEVYGQPEPPSYNISRVAAPVHIFRGDADRYTSEKNLGRLLKELPNVKSVNLVNRADFKHTDFVFGDDAHEVLYPDVLNILKSDANYLRRGNKEYIHH